MSEKNKINFWAIFGRLTGLLSAIWIIIQLYNNYIETEYNISANGDHYKFQIPESYKNKLEDYEKIISLDEVYRNEINDEGAPIQYLLDKYKEEDESSFKSSVDYEVRYNKLIQQFNSLWEFEIRNDGNKPLEDLILETGFNDGYYHVSKPDDEKIRGEFSKKVSLGELNPGQKMQIKLWVNDNFLYPEFTEEKIRITHKFGFQGINFPVNATGIIAWDIRNGHIGSFIFMLVLCFTLFYLGLYYYPKFEKQEKERKLKEFQEQEKLREELKKKKG